MRNFIACSYWKLIFMSICGDSFVNVRLKLVSGWSYLHRVGNTKSGSLSMDLAFEDYVFGLFSFVSWNLNLFAYLNSSSTHIEALRVNTRGMTYLGVFKRLRNGFMRMVLMKLRMLILQNWKIWKRLFFLFFSITESLFGLIVYNLCHLVAGRSNWESFQRWKRKSAS